MAAVRLLLVTLLGGALLACASVRVSVDYDPSDDFTAFHAFAWLPTPPGGDPTLGSPLLHARIRDAIARELEAKSYRENAGTPDFYVTWHVSVESKLDVQTVNRGYVGTWGYAVSIPETRVHQYEEGTLMIDVLDARKKRLVWRGVAKGRLRQQPKPEQVTARVNEAVSEILLRFPPQRHP